MTLILLFAIVDSIGFDLACSWFISYYTECFINWDIFLALRVTVYHLYFVCFFFFLVGMENMHSMHVYTRFSVTATFWRWSWGFRSQFDPFNNNNKKLGINTTRFTHNNEIVYFFCLLLKNVLLHNSENIVCSFT